MAQTADEIAARQAVEAQLLAHDDRRFTAQRTSVDSAKLVATVVLALAGTLVGTALQVTPRGSFDVAAVVVLGIALLLILIVMLVDRIELPNFALINAGVPDQECQERMQLMTAAVLGSNQKTVHTVYVLALGSIVLSTSAGALSSISLILK